MIRNSHKISAAKWCAIFLLTLLCTPFVFSEPRVIEITCQKSVYKPDVIRLKKGEPVILAISTTDVLHGFAIDEFDIAKEVTPGRPLRVELTPDRVGEFAYYCVVRCGKKHLQMRGKLIVTD